MSTSNRLSKLLGLFQEQSSGLVSKRGQFSGAFSLLPLHVMPIWHSSWIRGITLQRNKQSSVKLQHTTICCNVLILKYVHSNYVHCNTLENTAAHWHLHTEVGYTSTHLSTLQCTCDNIHGSWTHRNKNSVSVSETLNLQLCFSHLIRNDKNTNSDTQTQTHWRWHTQRYSHKTYAQIDTRKEER